MTTSAYDLLLHGGHIIDPSTGRDGMADVAVMESGVTHWGYEELSPATEISREAALPVHAHLGQMWALPLETGARSNSVDADSDGTEVLAA